MLYLVIQKPKHRYRDAYNVVVFAVEANTKAEAVRIAKADENSHIGNTSPEYGAPYASEVKAGDLFFF